MKGTDNSVSSFVIALKLRHYSVQEAGRASRTGLDEMETSKKSVSVGN
jgi:hypothetical protein